MSVQTQQFRVVGVNTQTGKDVSVVIDAATKAAAEVKAEQMQIETTHIVRLKQDEPTPPDEHELFSSEAAEARAGTRTINLIEEVVPPEEPKQSPAEPASPGVSATGSTARPATTQPAPAPAPQPTPAPHEVIPAITRPSYSAPSVQRDRSGAELSGLRAFGIVLIVLMGISAGAYFVLVHQPNTVTAGDDDLVFGQDLFSDVLDDPPSRDAPFDKLRDAFNEGSDTPLPDGPPIALDQQLKITPQTPHQKQAEAASAAGSPTPHKSKLKLQSIVTTNKGRFAVINGKLYEQGGNIGSAKLVSVADDWVLIEREGKQFTLQIHQSASK